MSFYITTPIYYPNGAPHLGHAYATVLCDVLARFHRLKGDPTYFLTGTDENSQKIAREAAKQGRATSDVLEENVGKFRALFETLEVSYDQFIRTSDRDRHWPGAVELWNRLLASGDLYKKTYTGLYCVGAESYVTEKDLRPGGLCPDHDEQPIQLNQENWFFRLSGHQQFLIDEIESGRLEVMPEGRRKEVLSFLAEPLEDISFSRLRADGEVGIPLPNDETQTMYVWCDALANYISALGFGQTGEGDDLMEKFWPASVHVVGKDILRFHAVYWPAMLRAAGLELPRRIFAHGLITSGGRKMSKSLGNVIDPHELVGEFGVEATRLLLAKELSWLEDPETTAAALKAAYNAHLANGIGNLLSRTMKMAVTYDVQYPDLSEITPHDLPEWPGYEERFLALDIAGAATVVWEKVTAADQFIQRTQPFKTVKENPEQAKRDVTTLVAEVYGIALLLEPFMPQTSKTMREVVLSRSMPEPLFARKD